METSECAERALMEVMNTLLGDSAWDPPPGSVFPTYPPGPGPVLCPPPGHGPVLFPPPPPGLGPGLLPQPHPGSVSLAPPGPRPVPHAPPGPGPVLPPPKPGTRQFSLHPPGSGPVLLPPLGHRPLLLPPAPPGLGPVVLPQPQPGPGPVCFHPRGPRPVPHLPFCPGPVHLPRPGPGPVFLPQTFNTVEGVFSGGHSGWRNRPLAHVLQQHTRLMAGLNSSQSAQLYGPADQVNSAPVSHFQPNMVSNLRPAGTMSRQQVYWCPAPSQLHTGSNLRKRRRQHQQDDDQPRIKKPLNAFMLYLKEQRRNMEVTDSVAVSKVLGERWKQLSEEEQAKYFEQARREARLHTQQHNLKAPPFDQSAFEEPSMSDSQLESAVETPSDPHWSQSTHFDGMSFTFDNVDQLVSVFENELPVEKPNLPDYTLDTLETPCFPDSMVMTSIIGKSVVAKPSHLNWSPSTEFELENYNSNDVEELVSGFESDFATVLTGVPDSTVISPRQSAETPRLSGCTAETPSSTPNSQFTSTTSHKYM